MKKTISSIVALAILICILASGLIESITKVFAWLITLKYNSPDISVFGQLVVKYVTWLIVYSLVGALFNALHWFDSSVMKITYFIISTIISFFISWLIMCFEKYMVIIAIVISAIIITILAVFITFSIINRNKQKEKTGND